MSCAEGQSEFNNNHARTEGVLKPARTYMFGRLIDVPPSHPDTIATTLMYIQRSLLDMGMAYVHLSVDMQLCVVTKQVCWHQQLQFQNVIVHPGDMHIIQLFIGCIAKLMNGSALDIYVAPAYRGLTGLFNGKSWVKALRYFRAVSAVLLKRFLSSGPKTFEEIDEYLAVARLHPKSRHWVDNFLLPTVLIHQFERAEREGDYYLKQLTMKRMLKYFFLAGHVQYTPVISPSTCWRCDICPRMRRGILCQVHLCVDTMRGTGMLSLATNLESRQPSEWAKEL